MKTLGKLFTAAYVSGLVLAATSSIADGQDKSTRDGQTAASTSEIRLPPWASRLNLTSQQDQQVRGIIRDYDAKVAAVWQSFTECYQQTVKIEAVLLTAIEDNLTEAQRKQARELRHKTAQSDNTAAATSSAPPITLTTDQEAAADKTNAKYLSRLRSLNRDIGLLHNRLVSLEADKIVEIEKLLTKPQLETLSQIRQEAPLPPEPNVHASGSKAK